MANGCAWTVRRKGNKTAVLVQCPNCGTRFRVDAELIRPEGSRARCSSCGYRFLVYPEPSGAEGLNGSELAVTEEVAEAGPQRQGRGGSPAAEAGEEEAPVFGLEPGAGGRDQGARSLARRRKSRGRRLASFLLGSLLLLLVVGLVVELGYAFRSQLLAQPWVRSVVQKGLDTAGVDWELPLALSRYRVAGMEARFVTLSSGRRVTLMEGTLVNTAPFAQDSPKLEIRADPPGGGVAYRRTKRPGERFPVSSDMNAEDLRRQWERARAAFPASLGPGERKSFVVVLAAVPPGSQRFQVELAG